MKIKKFSMKITYIVIAQLTEFQHLFISSKIKAIFNCEGKSYFYQLLFYDFAEKYLLIICFFFSEPITVNMYEYIQTYIGVFRFQVT